jgi:hypothetical protein
VFRNLIARLRAGIVLSRLGSLVWWKDATRRAVYTLFAVALPYVAAVPLFDVHWVTVLLAGGLGVIGSYATSLAGLPEAVGVNLPWWLAAVERVVKTFFQSIAAGNLGAVLITDVAGGVVLQAALGAALLSLLRLILATLPADPTRGSIQPVVTVDLSAAAADGARFGARGSDYQTRLDVDHAAAAFDEAARRTDRGV